MDVDVAICGAGPAGLATALTLRQHNPQLKVTVLAGAAPGREKIGETLPPGAQATLRALGVWEEFLRSEPLPAHGTRAAWGASQPEDNEFIFHPDARGWHIDRRQFDAMLMTAAVQRGIPVRCETAHLVGKRLEGGWNLASRPAGECGNIAARVVVDATGRHAQIATQAGATRIAVDQLVAVAVSFLLPVSAPMTDTTALVESCADGWWYSSLLPDGRLIVACLTDADIARERRLRDPGAWLAATAHAPHTRARLMLGYPEGAPVIRSADTGMLDRVTGDGWLATGDAASTFDPLSSQGVLKACRQGMVAAYALIDHLSGDRNALPKYEALLQREQQEFLKAKRDFYRRETRWARQLFWRRRHGWMWLRPDAVIERVASARAVSPRHLSASEFDRLQQHGTPPQAAQEIVSAFVAETPTASGEQVIRALQHLIDAGAMREHSS